MAARHKYLLKDFPYSVSPAQREEELAAIQAWLNERAQHYGQVIHREASDDLAIASTTLTLGLARADLNANRKIRLSNQGGRLVRETLPLTKVVVSLTVSRGHGPSDPENHAAGVKVYNEAGDLVGEVATPINSNSTTTLVMNGVLQNVSVNDDLTAGDEVMRVSARSTVITFTRATGAAIIDEPYDILDDNGPWSVEDRWVHEDRLYLLLVDDN